MTWNSTFKSPAKPMQRKTPMNRGEIRFKPADEKAAQWLKRMKSRGMKGRAPNTSEKRFHDLLASVVGCIACRQEGMFTPFVSVHHIDGRTKPWAHWMVLPLCGPHHQDAGIPGVVAVHPWKAQFEARYGTQRDLQRECVQILLDRGCAVPDGALMAACMEVAPV